MAKLIGNMLVGAQLAGIGMAVWVALYAPAPRPIFLAIALVGVVLGLYTLYFNRPGNFSIHPMPLNRSELVTTGPYRIVRHPMYLSVVLFLLGLALYAGNWPAWVGLTLATGAMMGKTHIEEKYLVERYPEYRDYQARTRRIIPFVY